MCNLQEKSKSSGLYCEKLLNRKVFKYPLNVYSMKTDIEAGKSEVPEGLLLDKKNPLFCECPD